MAANDAPAARETHWRACQFAYAAAVRVAWGVGLLGVLSALFAPWVVPHAAWDPASLQLADALLPPAWHEAGHGRYPLGTDGQGRDILSAMLHGARVSLFVGGVSMLLSALIGVPVGLLSGWLGGRLDSLLMRVCDVMLSFPALLVALLISGVGRVWFPQASDAWALAVLILAIGLTGWVPYARTVRSVILVERHQAYVLAARVTGVGALDILRRHLLPRVLEPVRVLATLQVSTAILTEASLSFLGVGAPPTAPSLGTLIRRGNDFLLSGEWWVTVFPGSMLVLIAVSFQRLGDGWRDAFDLRRQRAHPDA
jgi:peptide/nickel transport system permease protein